MKWNYSITLLSVLVMFFCFSPQVQAIEDESVDAESDVQIQRSPDSEDNESVDSNKRKESNTRSDKANKESSAKQKSKDSKGNDKDKNNEVDNKPNSNESESKSEKSSEDSTEIKQETESEPSSGDTDAEDTQDIPGENKEKNDEQDNESNDTHDTEGKENQDDSKDKGKSFKEKPGNFQLQKSSLLKKGDKNSEVKKLQKQLNSLGFVVKVTSSFDIDTEKKVKQFQKYYDLGVDGIVGPNTFAMLDQVLKSPLQRGEKDIAVIPFKEKLNQMGYDGIAISDVFGPHTERRVKEFQADQGLPVSGILEENTQAKINALFETDNFSKGDRHPAITELKRNLNQLGFDGLAIADLYGSFTTKRVKEFQEYYGLKATGNTNSVTFNKIDEILSSPLQNGNSISTVIPFKKKLNQLGYDGIAISDVFGPHTERRVKEFQADQGLPVSGILEENTQSKINALFETDNFSKGDRHPAITELKRNLNQLGFDGLAIADLYGSFTTKRVKEFQEYYGLSATGNTNSATFNKIDEILYSPLQNGNSIKSVIPFKKKLNRMGYDGIAISNVFGPHTERRVKEFQVDQDLPVSGILEKHTQDAINDYFIDIFSKGGRHEAVTQLKINLNKLGFDGLAIADLYGSFTAKRVKDFQKYYGLEATGKANLSTLEKVDEILSSPLQKGKSNKSVLELKRDLNKLGYNGLAIATKFGSFTETRVKQFQVDYKLAVNGIADEVTLAKIKELLKTTNYTKYDITLDEAVDKQMKLGPQTSEKQAWVSKDYIKNGKVNTAALNVRLGPSTDNKKVGLITKGQKVNVIGEYNGWYVIECDHNNQFSHANLEQVKQHLDPDNFTNHTKQKYQFLDLSKTSSASKRVLNNHLKGKGTLKGQGQAFIDAGRKYGINDVYLISHATLETGNGTSKLATGVEVGKNKSGKPILVTKKNRKKLKEIKKVYNMFGVNAFDSCPLECGAKKAYKQNWTSPSKAIVGGASFIGNNYVKKGQDTIYKMRWNPGAMEKEEDDNPHQYATDVGWATKQINTMYDLYQSMKIKNVYLDIPEYK